MWWWIVRVLVIAALAVGGYLLIPSLTEEAVVGCSWAETVDCDSALASSWGKWLGAPVALGGVLCYAIFFVGSLLAGRRAAGIDALGWRLLELAIPLAIGAAVWFCGVQLFALEAWCPFCLVVHACGVLASIFVLTLRRTATLMAPRRQPLGGLLSPAPRPTQLPPPAIGVPTLLGVLSLAALVLGQLFFPTSVVKSVSASAIAGEFSLTSAEETAAEAEPLEPLLEGEFLEHFADSPANEPVERPAQRKPGKRELKLLGGKLKIDVYEHPVLGDPEAKQVIIEFFDYGCPHCRHLHELVTEARPKYGDQLAIVVLAWPLEARCNKLVYKTKPTSRNSCRLAELAIAVSQVNGNAFPDLHEFLMAGKRPPQYTAALIRAQELVGRDRLSETLRSGKPTAKLKKYIDLLAALAQNQKLGLPTQIVGKTVFSGPLNKVEELTKMWEENLELKTTGK